jgi:hypothetical protein
LIQYLNPRLGRHSSEVDDDEEDEETDNGDNFDLGTITGQ